MSRTNTTDTGPRTGGGARAVVETPLQQLRRSVLACLLWEQQAYESGTETADRIARLACEVSQAEAEDVAREARNIHGLRHASMHVLTSRMAANLPVSKEAVADVLQRADEPAEFLAMYWKDGKRPIPAQAKRGVAQALTKFDAYQLGKWDRKGPVRIRDVMRLVHPTPKDDEQSKVWQKLIAGELEAPDTWEVNLSAGADKKETFERMLREGKLGYMALLRNLSGMVQAGVDRDLIKEAILARRGADKVLPFRFVAAARAAPEFEGEIEQAMLATLAGYPKLPGRTVVVIDTSGSMGASLSGKSDMKRITAGGALAAILREVCEDVVVYATAGNDGGREHATTLVPATRRGIALVDYLQSRELQKKIGWGGIFTKGMCDYVRGKEGEVDRMIVLTDEQDTAYRGDPLSAEPCGEKNYMINVAAHKHGVADRNKWVSISGFSEAVVQYIREVEAADALAAEINEGE